MTDPQDPYCYAGTNILKNLCSYRDQHQFSTFESHIVALALVDLREKPLTISFGPERLKDTHRYLFDGVYSWAGAFREGTGCMTKQRDGYTVTYADSIYINQEIEKLFTSLANENYLQGLTPRNFAARAAHYYGELDAIHPFREGNTRTLRPFITDLAMQAGHHLDWSRAIDNEESRKHLYFARDVAVINADPFPLAAIIEIAISTVQVVEENRSIEVKHRVLVMNGQRIVQREQAQEIWQTEHVDQAGSLKPSIYNIYQANKADKDKVYEGVIVHIDKQNVYQQVGSQFVKHECKNFDKVPQIASIKSIIYDQSTGHVHMVNDSQKQRQKRSRSF